VQDDVLVEPEVAGDLDGDRDAHRGDGRHDVDVVGANDLGQFGAGARHELTPMSTVINSARASCSFSHSSGRSTCWVPISVEYVRSPTVSEHTEP
jgi:hypothetical protein